MKPELPAETPILDGPYWRIDVRPSEFHAERLAYSELRSVINQTKVGLRGWDFPHLTNRENEIIRGVDFVGGWSDFINYEYWRFYQSGYLFFLQSVREHVEEDWRAKTEQTVRQRMHWLNVDWTTVKGYFSIINFLYTVTEVFEFAARLSQRLRISDSMDIQIALSNIDGFILTTEIDRGSLSGLYRWPGGRLGKKWTIPAASLLAETSEHAIAAVKWFFERFGWEKPNIDQLRRDQLELLKRRA
jgi:hypothetical protein